MTENKTSMAYWLPKIQGLPIPMPETVLIPVEYSEGGDWLSEKTHSEVEKAVEKMGYPAFIKTDLSAGKHSYIETCFIKSKNTLHRNLERLRDDNFCTDCYFGYIAVRKYIELASQFKAFKGLPIAPERRYFIDDGKVQCHHRYWPENSIEFYNLKVPKFPEGTPYEVIMKTRTNLANKRKAKYLPLLEKMNHESPDEITLLTHYSKKVANVLPGYWSVDYALARDGNWYLIDMAEGEKSYHDDDCPVRKAKDGLL